MAADPGEFKAHLVVAQEMDGPESRQGSLMVLGCDYRHDVMMSVP